MCGICGAFQIGGAPRDPLSEEVLKRMTAAMYHRGPDDEGLFRAPGASIGARRLSIIDVEGGHQPFSDGLGRVWAAQNGEIFNHEDLRAELIKKGHRFASRCDTEVIPHLYREYGLSFVKQMRGMFGVALWDIDQQRGVLVRDRLGVKPLYYAMSNGMLLFASELKSLLASGLIETDLDYSAIDAYLTLGFVPGPATPLAKIRKLMPGHLLIVESGAVRTESYWEYPEPRTENGYTAPEYAEQILAKLRESVRIRMMSDVPLGAMLSGGLDSSLIVALMSEISPGPVKTFSVGFAGNGSTNELDDARCVASIYATEHHELALSVSEPVDLAQLVWHMDEPIADLSALGFLALCQLARRSVTVALSGQGADELFGGYRKHRAAALAQRASWLTTPLGPALRAASVLAPTGWRRPLATLAARTAAERQLAMTSIFTPELRARAYRGPLLGLDPSATECMMRLRSPSTKDALPAALYFDAKLGLVDDMLQYFDRASMAHSLEVRVPFLDHELVELAARVPADLKVRGLDTKFILKQAARSLVPDRIIDKPKVGFFNAEAGSWLRAQTSGVVADCLLSRGARYTEFIDREFVERSLRRELRSPDESHRLLTVLMLEVWLSTYLPRANALAVAKAA